MDSKSNPPALARPRETTAAPPWSANYRALLPKNLSSFRQLTELLRVFEEILPANSVGELSPSDAVAALNHLKRLRRQAGGDSRLAERTDACICAFAATARAGLGSMSAKNVALVMNSLVDAGPAYAGFLADATARVRELCCSGHEFHTQASAPLSLPHPLIRPCTCSHPNTLPAHPVSSFRASLLGLSWWA
jgi:hypothetical protein